MRDSHSYQVSASVVPMSFYVLTVDGWFGKHTVSPIQQKTHCRLLALCWRLCVRKGLAACAGITLGGGVLSGWVPSPRGDWGQMLPVTFVTCCNLHVERKVFMILIVFFIF
jgi:hypothetical protein